MRLSRLLVRTQQWARQVVGVGFDEIQGSSVGPGFLLASDVMIMGRRALDGRRIR